MAGLLDLSTLKIPGLNGVPMQQPDPAQVAPVAPQAGLLDSLFAPKPPHKADNYDRLNIIGATLRDIGSGLRGGEATALPAAQQAIAAEGVQPAAGAKAAGAKKGAGSPYTTADLYKVAQSLFPGDPKAQFLWTTQNTDFLKDTSEASYGFHATPGGDSYGTLAGGMKVAPKLVDNQGQYGTQTDAGYTGTGTSAPSYQQQADTQNAITASAKAVEDARHNHVDEGQGVQRLGIEGGQLGVAKQHMALDQRDFGHKSNPTAPVVYSAADYAKLPSGQHLQYVAPDGSLRIKP